MIEPSLEGVEKTIHNINSNLYPGIAAAIFYGVISGLMSFMNKIVLTTYQYRHPEVIILAESTLIAAVLEICRITNYIDIPCYSLKRGVQFVLPSICFALHTFLALLALSDLSIPMYNVLRRLLPLSTLIIGAIVLKKRPSLLLVCSIILVVLGCITAGLGDLSFHLSGYATAICSVLTQSCYLVYIQKTGVESKLSSAAVLHLNSINCIPLLTVYTLLNNKLIKSIDDIQHTDSGFIPAFMAVISMGCLLNYSLFLCATLNSALTTSLVGVIKGVITTIIGFFTFGGVVLNMLTLLGIIMNSFGGAIYIYSKYTGQIETKLQEEFIADHVIEITTPKTRNKGLYSALPYNVGSKY